MIDVQDGLDNLDPYQQRALELALRHKMLIVTGGPGVGKTHTIRAILEAFPYANVELAAPTGKAAKRMTEATGHPAQTIHRLLYYSPQQNAFLKNEDDPLECDLLIIDECSMIDVLLMEALLRAVPENGCRLILVGDKDQLPSVGPGKVFGDLIESGFVPYVELKQLHRQAANSLIHVNAQRINRGEGLVTTLEDQNPNDRDLFCINVEKAEDIPAMVVRMCNSIPNTGLSIQDVQVLCPQKVGPIGTQTLNPILRDKVFNPAGEKIKGTMFALNDRVIQLRNNYDLSIFNGDIGTITDFSEETKHIVIEFDGIGIAYPMTLLDDLALAYALTIHKSQGSEFKAVIIPVHTANYIMLKRNLLYTGITRGKNMVILIGTQKAIKIAIRTIDSSTRNTGLKEKLAQAKAIASIIG